MKIIGIEEHWISRAFAPSYPVPGTPGCDASIDLLTDIGAGRIAAMDDGSMDVQVLGLGIPTTMATLADIRSTNDQAAEAVSRFPSRLGAFAALPLADAQVAAAELKRTVRGYGFKGAMVNGTIGGQFLDHPRFDPLLSAAVELDVPLYLHVAHPVPAVADIYYTGAFDDVVGFTLGSTAAGWHWEAGLHVLRMIVSGVFDRHPKLQVIIGHMGELIPFYWDRIEAWLEPRATTLRRPVRAYFPTNIHVTTSGYTGVAPFRLALEVFGVDRLIFSVDYPFSPIKPAVEFLRSLPVAAADLEKIASGNVSRLLKIK